LRPDKDLERYMEYFNKNPGVYFRTTGWIERSEDSGISGAILPCPAHGLRLNYEELVARYGEDNAIFLYQELGNLARNYRQMTFIETGIEQDSGHVSVSVLKEDLDKGIELLADILMHPMGGLLTAAAIALLGFITTIRGRAVIRGKMLAAAIVTLLIYSACMPFMTFTYLLRGVDLPTTFFLLGAASYW
jgi:hypothetical protein